MRGKEERSSSLAATNSSRPSTLHREFAEISNSAHLQTFQSSRQDILIVQKGEGSVDVYRVSHMNGKKR